MVAILDLTITISITLMLMHFINSIVAAMDSACMKTYKTTLHSCLYDIYSQRYSILKIFRNLMAAILDFAICGRQGQNWAWHDI